MGKKTLGKKGYKLGENKMEEGDGSEEVGDCNDALPTSAEEVGVKFSNGDKKKKKHDVKGSGNDVECSANALSANVEEDGAKLRDGDKKKKKKKRHGVGGNDVEVGASQSEAVAEGDVDVSKSEKENNKREKRKVEVNKDEKKAQKARKKDKRVNDDGEVSGVKEASKKEANGSKEVGDCNNGLPTSAEEVGVKFSNGDKKKKRHDVNGSGNDVECSANALPTSAEDDGAKLRDGDKKKKKKNRHGFDPNDVEVGASQSESVAEGDVDVSKGEKENDKREKRKVEVNKDEKKSQKARKKDKRVNDDGEVSEVKVASKEEANGTKEVGDCNSGLPTSAEEVGVKFSNGDKKKKRHDVNGSGNDVECRANALPTSAEDDGAKLRDGDKKKKKKNRHGVDANDVEVGASQRESVAEGDVDVSKSEKENDKRKKRKKEFNKDEKEAQKAKKKDKRINDDGEVSEVKEASKETHTGVEGNVSLQKNDMKDLGNNVGLEARKDKKKRHKENKKKDGTETVSSMIDLLGDNRMEKEVNRQNNSEKEENDKMNNGEEGDLKKKEEEKKKKKKRKRDNEGGDVVVMNSIIDGKEVGKGREQLDGKILEDVENSRKKRKSDKKKHSDELEAVLQEMSDSSGIVNKEFVLNESNAHLSRNEAGGRKVDVNADNVGDGNKDKKKEKKKKENKKVQSSKEGSGGKGHKGVPRTADPSENPTSKGRSKKVSFSDHVEVFTSSDGPTDAKKNIKKDGLVHGKRFSLEEDEKIKQAVFNYIEAHGLGEEGLDMVLNCKSHKGVKHCWKEIGAALPWRPSVSVYYRAHTLFQRSEERKWTPEEFELLKDHYAKNGADWKTLADAMGKHRVHVKDAWRRTKLANMKKGHWSQDEYQKLFDLVNTDLRMKACEERKSKHGMLRDNICWGAISDRLETRNNATCCIKWYKQLQSPMVAEELWADVDDYHLLNELYNLDACCIEDVDWDCLLEHRSGDVCRRRWDQMARHIGGYGTKSFSEQVEVLSKRYCADVLEAREAYDSRPAVP